MIWVNLMHRLFGWHYVMYQFAGDFVTSRIKIINNEVYIDFCCQGWMPINNTGTREFIPITMDRETLKRIIGE